MQVSLALAVDHGYEWDLCVPAVRPSQTSPATAWAEFKLAGGVAGAGSGGQGYLTHLHFQDLKMHLYKG